MAQAALEASRERQAELEATIPRWAKQHRLSAQLACL